jgi:hypothetical protein
MRVLQIIGFAAAGVTFLAAPSLAQRLPQPSPAVEQSRDTVAGPQVDSSLGPRRDSARPPKDSVGLRTPPPDSVANRTPINRNPLPDTIGMHPAAPDSVGLIHPPRADSLGRRPASPDSIARPTPPADSAMKPITTPGTVPR